MSRTLTASDRASLIRLASSLPVGSPERKAILAGLEKRADPLPSTVSLQDLASYRVVWPVNYNTYKNPLSEYPGSVFYLTQDGYMIVVLALKKKALVRIDQRFRSLTEGYYAAKAYKSLGNCLKENARAIELNLEPSWKEIRVLP